LSKKIVIVSSGQPSLNPRLVKEADALSAAGYKVTVLYAYWNNWGTKYDEQLLAKKKWTAICVGGDPEHQWFTWSLSRIMHKLSGYIVHKMGNYEFLADAAVARSSFFLTRAAKKHEADLYIGHNLGALQAVAEAAKLYKKPCGFDAEDFHRQEVNDEIDSFHYKLCKYLEDKYFPFLNYLTASSPFIAEQYAGLYNRQVTSILNVFPKAATRSFDKEDGPLKLFWFSQTVGPNRGLEMVIEAIRLANAACELHILGQSPEGYKQHFIELAIASGLTSDALYFYEPVNPDQLVEMATRFDIGLASETGFCLNNKLALSNKLFTYVQSGLVLAASNTTAQKWFIEQYPQTGKLYNDASQLSGILTELNRNRGALLNIKRHSFEAGQTQLNWEHESQKFLTIIKDILAA